MVEVKVLFLLVVHLLGTPLAYEDRDQADNLRATSTPAETEEPTVLNNGRTTNGPVPTLPPEKHTEQPTTSAADRETKCAVDQKAECSADGEMSNTPERDATSTPDQKTNCTVGGETSSGPGRTMKCTEDGDTTATPTSPGATDSMNKTTPRLLFVHKPGIIPDSTYNVLLMPTDLLQYASSGSYTKGSTRTLLKLSKPSTPGILRVLRIPILPPYYIESNQEYHIEVGVGLGRPDTHDADIFFLLSDNHHVIGMAIDDADNSDRQPCYGVDGDDELPGGITDRRGVLTNRGRTVYPLVRSNLPSLSNLPVSDVTLLLKPKQYWGACLLSDFGGYINPVFYNEELDVSERGLFLDVYLDDDREIHNIHYIRIKIFLSRN